MTERVCVVCGGSMDGKRRTALTCGGKVCKVQRYREANAEKVAARDRRYRTANAEKVAKWNRRYCEANPEKVAEQALRYREANRDKAAERSRRWYNERLSARANSSVVLHVMTIQQGAEPCE